MVMFDLEEAKRASGLSPQELARVEEMVSLEFKHDEMMYELHLLRVLKALKEGWVSLEEALSAQCVTR